MPGLCGPQEPSLTRRASPVECRAATTTSMVFSRRDIGEPQGLDLLAFYDFPKAMWKSLRTTNTLENLNREFRRRTTTQASFGTEAAAITLL